MVTDRQNRPAQLAGPVGARRWWLLVALSAVVMALIVSPAAAAPGDDDEGGNPTLRGQLDTANRGFLEAQTALEESRKRQTDLTAKLDDTQKRLATLTDSANQLAVLAYRTSGLSTTSALLSSVSADNFVDRASAVNIVANRNDRQLREYIRLRKELAGLKATVDGEVAKQEQQLAEMDRRRKDAERALTAAGGGGKTAGFGGSTQRAAVGPGAGGCNQDDPTTSGCLTARTLHALNQARAAGFTRHTSCYRGGGGGEHPRGRACDFAAAAGGFGGVAGGGDKAYGDRLAAYFVGNAKPLNVMYVIWFRQIWQPSTGWRAYSGRGAPNVEHTNHVHLSVL